MTTILTPRLESTNRQPGEDLSHLCSVHTYDHECMADPDSCVAFCGYRFQGLSFDTDGTEDPCCVCDEMFYETPPVPPCRCNVCDSIW